MIIKRILNNNAVMSVDESGEDIIVKGKGIAFQKKSGDKINQNKITLKQTRACFKHPPERTKITQQFTFPLPLWYSIIV